jgi:integrase
MNDTPQETKRRKRWSWHVGEYGNRVLVFEERNGRVYGQIRGRKVALGHASRDLAKTWAKDQEKKLRDHDATAADPTPTVAKVFAAYAAAHPDDEKSPTVRYEDERCGGRLPDPEAPEDQGDVGLFVRVLGADRDLSRLTLGEWEQFIRARQTGAVDAWGRPVTEEKKRRRVRARTVESDCEWLVKVCNWALEWEDRYTGQPLMREHPLKRARFHDAVPHEENPRRPVATQDRYEAILAKAGAVHPYLPPVLSILNGTGRRVSAVLALRYEDLRLAKTKSAPHGAVAWPGETDKMGKAWSAPMSAAVRATLDALLAERPGIGPAYLFPAPKDPAKPVDRWFIGKRLRRAERLAEVPKQSGSLFHAYRRKWGTERKHLPIQDVAQAGGWKNTACLATIYQQPDDATLYAVVSQPAELREAQA